ncbi:MAG: fibronectin type III domain-containing protein, partial [Eubacterium sp.]|nr:fibronectin type III domain-containing protein [Eubacterium sp.]
MPPLFDVLEDDGVEPEEVELTVKKVTSNSAVIMWESELPYISYKVCIFNFLTEKWDEYKTTQDTSLKLVNLTEDTDYRVGIFTPNDVFIGETEFTTGLKKATVEITDVTSKEVVLEVSHPDSKAKVFIYRSTDKKDFRKIATVTDGQYVDKKVKEATKYYYRVVCKVRNEDNKNKSRISDTVETYTLKGYDLPKDTEGTTKTYAFYTAVTATGSPQYALLNSEYCTTDEKTGIRMVDGCYCIALGSYYGTRIGTKYRIVLEGNKVLKCILCDQKADRHTDGMHQYAMQNRDIMEFYIERSMLPRGISGDYGHLPQFSGKIISIEQYVESDADVEEAMKREHLNKERMKNIKKEEKEKKKKEKEKKKAEKKKKKEEEKK